jgi:LysR family transcriptional repressor of citA
MDVQWLRTFVAVARTGSLRRAAERLYLAPATVALHVRALEGEVGAPLLLRGRRGVRLSPEGARFLTSAQEALAALDHGREEVLRWRAGYRDRLRLAASPLLARSRLPRLLRRFTAERPQVDLEVHVVPSPEVGTLVAQRSADLGLGRMPPLEAGLAAEPLHADPVVLVAPYDGGDADSPVPDWREVLARYTLFTHNHPLYWDDLLSLLRRVGVPLRTAVVTQVDVTKRFIEEGLGCSFLPESAVWVEVAESRLTEVPAPDLALPTTATFAVYRQPPDLPPAAAAFLGLLRRALRGGDGA